MHKSIFRAETLKREGQARPWAAQGLEKVSGSSLVIGTEIQLELIKAERRMCWLLVSKKDWLLQIEARQWALGSQQIRHMGSEAARTVSPFISAFLVLSHCILTPSI